MEIVKISIKDLMDKRLNPHNKLDFKTAKKIYNKLKLKKRLEKLNIKLVFPFP
jgi:hypothetical protein